MFMPCLGIIFQRVTDKEITGHKTVSKLHSGDVENIGMHKIDRIDLVPLLDIICNLIFKMNQSGRPTALAALQDMIRKEYPKIEPPSAKKFRKAIQTLLKQKILKYDLKQLHICYPPTTLYHSSKSLAKYTIECQNEQSIMNGYDPSNPLKIKKGL